MGWVIKRVVFVLLSLCFTLCLAAVAEKVTGPPPPVPYREVPDPPDDAVRHIVVKAEDRGPVWLLTGFLSPWGPALDVDHFRRVRTKHWRYDMWPVWHPASVVRARNTRAWKTKQWGDWRDSPVEMGRFLEAVLRLREQGMTHQVLLCWKGPFSDRRHIGSEELEVYGQHICTIVKYARHMGLPVDYWEIWNEPKIGPYKGIDRGFWTGTWEEFLAVWDATYDGIRMAYPDAKVVGPSYGYHPDGTMSEKLRPFLDHCKEKGQRLEVLSWHVPECIDVSGNFSVVPDAGHRSIEELRTVVESEEYASLGVEEIHIDEWGYTAENTGPGTQIAIFHYYDLAGVHRAAKGNYAGSGNLNGILVSAKTPRTSYWCWVEYARQDTGVRLVTETNDRGVVALASRHDDAKVLRALVARSKRNYGAAFVKRLPPVKTTVDFDGVPISGSAEVTILRLGPRDGPMWEEEYNERAQTAVMAVADGKLSLSLDDVVENEVISILIGPEGAHEKEKALDAQWAPAKSEAGAVMSERELHKQATAKAAQAAEQGVIRVNCGAWLGIIDPEGNGWFADREYGPGEWGYLTEKGSMADRRAGEITGTANPEIYRTNRWAAPGYKFTVPNGEYLVRLYFCYYASGTMNAKFRRLFDVTIEDQTMPQEVNEFSTSVSDGELDIGLAERININAIEVIRR